MKRSKIINMYIEKYDYKSYLEIGISNGKNFKSINCDSKIGVDPCAYFKSRDILEKTSDEFFANNKLKFDIIFIDGLHHSGQVYRDIKNSLNVLNDGGAIICHDMNPTREEIQIVPRISRTWTGDCWKAWVLLRSERKDLEMFVVDTDYGCGIIRTGEQELIELNDKLTYENLDANRKEWLNLISIENFKEKINGTTAA